MTKETKEEEDFTDSSRERSAMEIRGAVAYVLARRKRNGGKRKERKA